MSVSPSKHQSRKYHRVSVRNELPIFCRLTLSYDDDCLCGKDATCTTGAQYVERQSTQLVAIDGLKVGCTPSELFLVSTLECFFNASYLYFLCQMIRDNRSSTAINISSPSDVFITRFPTNVTVSHLVDYLSSDIQQINSFYTATYLLDLSGGLTLVLLWICPRMVVLENMLFRRWKTRRSRIRPMPNASL